MLNHAETTPEVNRGLVVEELLLDQPKIAYLASSYQGADFFK